MLSLTTEIHKRQTRSAWTVVNRNKWQVTPANDGSRIDIVGGIPNFANLEVNDYSPMGEKEVIPDSCQFGSASVIPLNDDCVVVRNKDCSPLKKDNNLSREAISLVALSQLMKPNKINAANDASNGC